MKWITDRTPKNEQPILILTKYKFMDEERYLIVRGFYTDGKHNTEESKYCWNDYDHWEYDEENDSCIIPQSYWEERWYGDSDESIAIIDDKVVAWCEMAEALLEAQEQIKEQ